MDDYDYLPPQELQGPALPDLHYPTERLREGEAADETVRDEW
jgi:hypothetical protein